MPERPDPGRRRCLLAVGLGVCGAVGPLSPAWAQAPQERPQARLERGPDGLLLSARMPLQLAPALEDALLKGVALHFTWQAELTRPRWYWRDKVVAEATRVVRLAYQPLTRRWRVSVLRPGATGGVNSALHQNVDELADALASVARVSAWRVAPESALEPAEDLALALRFGLDATLLPRPFQIGVAGQSDWSPAWALQLTVPPPNTVAPEVAERPEPAR